MENEPFKIMSDEESEAFICGEVKKLYDATVERLRKIDWSGHYILGGPDGKTPIEAKDVFEWAEWYEEAAKNNSRHVAHEQVFGLKVSTVFLGLDHSWSGGPPLLFETMIYRDTPNKKHKLGNHIFEINTSFMDYQQRYSTWQEALEGHRRALELTTRVMSRFWMRGLRRLPRIFNALFVRAFNRRMEKEIGYARIRWASKRLSTALYQAQADPLGGDGDSPGGPSPGAQASDVPPAAGGDQVPE